MSTGVDRLAAEIERLESQERDGLRADNARLRALIKQAEDGGYASISLLKVCTWCRAYRNNGDDHFKHVERGTKDEPHRSDCPAFTPEGEVK
jgi:hypothetical protein